MKIALVVLTLAIITIPFFLAFIMRGIRVTYRRSAKKFPDRNLLKLFALENNLLNARQLMRKSGLTYTEAMIRLQSWVNNAVVRTLYSDSGETLYQLKHKMPEQEHVFEIKKYDDAKILEIVLNHISGVELSPAHFVWLFDVNIQEARIILKRLVALGLVKSRFDSNFQRSYISMVNPLEIDKISLPKFFTEERIEIKDADILKLAIGNEGRLTPTILCIEKQVSLDEAEELLDRLYDKGAFYIDVDEKEGTVEYILRESKLYKK
jgi:predicted transcriptional regulator